MALSVNEAQIGAQLDAVLSRDADARAVAIHSASRQDWPASLTRRGHTFELRWCESRLALREALVGLEPAGPDGGLVLLTPLSDQDLPADVAGRLARGRVFQVEGWDIVRQLFSAQSTDARLGSHDWMPLLLVELAGQGPFTPVASGILDADTAWREVLGRCLQLDSARPDAVALLGWTLRPEASLQLARLAERARRDTLAWLARHAGASGELTVRCIDAGRIADAVPLALVCGVVFSAAGEGQSALAQAAVRLERYVGHQPIGVAHGRQWAADAQRWMQGQSAEAMRGALDRADALLRDLHVAEFANLSDLLPHGFDQRLGRFAQALLAHVQHATEATLSQVEDTVNRVLQHHLAASQPVRMERVRMARRLARWWWTPALAPAPDLSMQAAQQADEGAWIDWARARLLGGDELADLSGAYASLRLAVQVRRDAAAQAFASTLAEALSKAATLAERCVPVEMALERLVAPLARHQPVLLLVVDGLSVSIFRELFERCERYGWGELVPLGSSRPAVGLAALPTITQISRASLLAGRVTCGAAPSEKLAFAQHPALLQAGPGKQSAPRLFHKADLNEEGHLATEVREVIGDPATRVVGVVYNAVDDHLDGPEQLQQRWSLEDLRLLLPILREAQAARRVLVVTADHGHVLEDGSRQLTQADSDRWRAGRQTAVPEEVAVSGARVLTPEGAAEAVLLWSERARYTGRKNGYHGGASPAEVVVPLSVFAPFGVSVPEWVPAPPQQPEWWDVPGALTSAPLAGPPVPMRATSRRTARPAPAPQSTLFSDDEAPLPLVAAAQGGGAVASAPADWITALLCSRVYAAQRQLAARVALTDEQMRRLLTGLDQRGGKLGKAAVAQRLGVPELRLAGLLSVARRLLNVDQTVVLSVDETAGVVELNRELLQQQFELSSVAGKAGRPA